MSDMKLIMENWRNFGTLNEEADPAKMSPERFPLKLSDVSPKASRITSRAGTKDQASDDDVIPVVRASFTAAELKPSQSSMDIDKAVNFAIQMSHPSGKLKAGGNLDAFISKDNFIMDGHHRWIGTAMANPAAKLNGFRVGFPGEQLVAVLNNMTKGKFGEMVGKPATGGFEQFNEQGILKVLQGAAQNGSWDNLTAADVLQALQTVSGVQGDVAQVVPAAAKKMASNLSGLTLSEPSWAPARPDMPIIDKGNVPDAVKALKQGEVDVNPPYAKTGRKYLDKPSEEGGQW